MYTFEVISKSGQTYISGKVDNNEVIRVLFHDDGPPTIGIQSTLPVNFEKAKIYIACMNAVFERVDGINLDHYKKEEN